MFFVAGWRVDGRLMLTEHCIYVLLIHEASRWEVDTRCHGPGMFAKDG